MSTGLIVLLTIIFIVAVLVLTGQFQKIPTVRLFINIFRYRKIETEWQIKYDAYAPKEGEPAPDFELMDVKGGKSIKLSEFKGRKPVGLIFGSFT